MQNVRVPEPQNAVTGLLEKTRARFVVSAFRVEPMLFAVDFHDQTRPVTGEVSEIGADRRLTPEVAAGNGELFELPPELPFGGRCIVT